MLPSIASNPTQIAELIDLAEEIQPEEIFAENVNARGPGLKKTEAALEASGFHSEAEAIGQIRKKKHWSPYVVELLRNLQTCLRERGMMDKLRFLLYPGKLSEADKTEIQKDDEGVIWL